MNIVEALHAEFHHKAKRPYVFGRGARRKCKIFN